jgi:hypothetical protein
MRMPGFSADVVLQQPQVASRDVTVTLGVVCQSRLITICVPSLGCAQVTVSDCRFVIVSVE